MSQPTLPPERESEAQFVIGVLSLLIGGLLLAMSAILFFTTGGAQLEGEGMPPFRIVAAIGAGLFALGAALEAPRLLEVARQRKSMHAVNAVLMSLLAFVLLGIVNFLSARHDFWRADLTSDGLYTLSEDSRNLVAPLDRDVRVVVLLPSDQDHEAAPIQAILDQYQAASSHVLVERQDLRSKTRLENQQLLEELELGGRFEDEVLGVVVQSGVRTQDGWKKQRSKHIPKSEMWEEGFEQQRKKTFVGEQKISSAIREVLEEARPKLYFLVGHEEAKTDDFTGEQGLGAMVRLLRQKDFEVATLNLTETGKVPDDCNLLVIAGPRVALGQREVEALTGWLKSGGDALVALEPVIDNRRGETAFSTTGLEQLLRDDYGVAPQDRIILAQVQTAQGIGIIDQTACDQHDMTHPAVAPLGKRGARIFFPALARPLATTPATGAKTTELVMTGNFTRGMFSTGDPFRMQREQRPPPDQAPGPFTLLVSSERVIGEGEAPKRSRVVVTGDADWLANVAINEAQFYNLELFINAVSWAMERETRLIGKTSRPKSYKLEMTPETLAAMKLFSFFGLPAVAICLGLFAWLLRRR